MPKYKVLWIDDRIADFDSVVETAYDQYDLDIDTCETWEEGNAMLQVGFDSYSAIILDFKGKIRTGESDDPQFLFRAISELDTLYRLKHSMIPWYVFSKGAGHVENLEAYRRMAIREERNRLDPYWGKAYYDKTPDDQHALFSQIQKTAPSLKNNRLRGLFREVFEEVENTEIWHPGAKEILFTVLKAHHFPEESTDIAPHVYYNQLRQLIEYIFRAYNAIGVIPDELIKNGKDVNIAECSLLLSGKQTNHEHNGQKFRLYQKVLDATLTNWLWAIIQVANQESHTSEFTKLTEEETEFVRQYFTKLKSSYLLYAYTLHLCDVILAFSTFYRFNPDKVQNARLVISESESKESKAPTHPAEYYEGLQGIVQEKDGVVFLEECILLKKFAIPGTKVQLFDISLNGDRNTKEQYHYFAKSKVINN